MKLEALLNALFPEGHTLNMTEGVVTGWATTAHGEIAVLGTRDHLAVTAEAALCLARFVLQVIKTRPECPILMLVDTQGQLLSKQQEILAVNGYLAHLVKCLELARRHDHRLLALVYAQAVSGGFLSFGLMADEIHALADAEVHVMNLPAMARITKLPLEKLEALSESSAIFTPGVESFYQLGGVDSIWSGALHERLHEALLRQSVGDQRRAAGQERGGRLQALSVTRAVLAG